MTAPNYITLDSDDIGANKIARAAMFSALDSNPVAIAQRGTDAPWLNGIGAIEAITSGSGNWTVPTGVYRIKVTAVGGGGGTATGSSGYAGGDTTFGTITAGGGGGGYGVTSGSAGSAAGGDINLAGETGREQNRSAIISTKGAGGHGSGSCGGSGGTVIKVFSVNPGDAIAYSVGAGGGGGSADESGTSGIIIIEY